MVEAMVLAAQKLDRYETVNIGLGRGHSVNEILKILLELDGYTNAKIKYDRSKPTISRSGSSTRRRPSASSASAKVDLREGLRRTLEWYRKQR